MKDSKSNTISRRSILKGTALLAAGIATVPVLFAGTKPARASKVPQAAMQYQDHPNGKADCSNCMQFIPGKSPTADGQCNVVAGSINPHGWCMAYGPKG